ncbi:hypothetical protein MN116_006055 [Schistosoma mekongi]|uniref:PHD finger protein 14 n=1 Tax=Schistosoma mekongi TaxID=38744 RepID=A0AAE1ZAV5_SCHME|nr:hypothetical protein MN116_006055 [Schistosoma mekongi]
MTSDALFTAIARRDPSKRQIKPVNTDHLALLDDLDDDSDSEYVCEEKDEDDDDDEEGSRSGCSNGDTTPSDSSVNSLSSGVSEASDLSQRSPSKSVKNSPITIKAAKDTYAPESLCAGLVNGQNLVSSADVKIKDVDIMICMLCLGDSIDPSDELIECDGCGIVVHEDCYKLVGSIFLSSGASSSSTDAWFCEPCLAGITSPVCELCPVLDGVFKKTDNNRWVHLLCALYTPGVAFNDPDNLMDVTLTELPQRQWSLHECSLCEDRFFAWTGVCISCDAGLCRTFFHVTCAQKHGLLSEPTIEESSADPFFAHCRQHTDKTVARHRRRNFLTAMLRLKKWRSNRQLTLNCLDEKRLSSTSSLEKESTIDPRIQRKLEHYRELYKDLLRHREKPYVPLVKTPMFLETSPVAMRMFVSKAKALNLPIELSSHMSNADSSKGPTPSYPVFTPDFISYFLERERKITEVSKHISTLQNTQRELQISDASASHSYNSVSAELEKLIDIRGDLRMKFLHIVNCLCSFVPDLKCSSELETILAEPRRLLETSNFDLSSSSNPVDFSNAAKFGSSAVVAASKRRSHHSFPSHKSRKVSKSEAVDQNVRLLKSPASSQLEKCPRSVAFESENVILECMVCHGLQDQHLITSCDTCGKSFHLACLDPPLLRMPKRSKLYGWQCSFCTKEVSSVPGAETIDVNAPRQLRRSTGMLSDRTPCIKHENSKSEVGPSSKVFSYPSISSEIKSSLTRKSVSRTLRRSRPFVSSAPTHQSHLTNPVKNVRRKSNSALKAIPSRRRSISATKQTTKRVSSQSLLEEDSKFNIDSKVSASPSVVMTHVCSTDFDQFKFTDETEDKPILHVGSSRNKWESDEEITQLRTSKVIKFVQIRDHESNGEPEAVERIAPLHQRYVICQEGSPHPKRSSTGKFRLKFKKL